MCVCICLGFSFILITRVVISNRIRGINGWTVGFAFNGDFYMGCTQEEVKKLKLFHAQP